MRDREVLYADEAATIRKVQAFAAEIASFLNSNQYREPDEEDQ